jgi:hypothetical protein
MLVEQSGTQEKNAVMIVEGSLQGGVVDPVKRN